MLDYKVIITCSQVAKILGNSRNEIIEASQVGIN